MEDRAQADSVFRLFVESIVGLAIFVIILGALGYFNSISMQQSVSDFQDLIKSAVHSSNGKVIKSDGQMNFAEGYAIDTVTAQRLTTLSAECFTFESTMSSIKVSSEANRAEFTQNIHVNVFIRCVSEPSCNPIEREDLSNCCSTCIISFGKELDDVSEIN